MSDLSNLAAGVPIPAPGTAVYTPAIDLTEKQALWTYDKVRLSVLANPCWVTRAEGIGYRLEESDDGENWATAAGAVAWAVGTRNDLVLEGNDAWVKAPSMFGAGHAVWRPSPSCWGRLNRALKNFIRLKVTLASGLWAVPDYHSVVLGYIPPGDWVSANLARQLPGTKPKPYGWNPGVAVGGPTSGQNGGTPPVWHGGGGGEAGGGAQNPIGGGPLPPWPEMILNPTQR